MDKKIEQSMQKDQRGNREIPTEEFFKVLGKKELELNIAIGDNIHLLSEIGNLKKRNETLEAEIKVLKNDKSSERKGSI